MYHVTRITYVIFRQTGNWVQGAHLDFLKWDIFVLYISYLSTYKSLNHIPDRTLITNIQYTSMHSSRMRTARLLAVSRSIQGGCVCPGGCIPACNGSDTTTPPPWTESDRCKGMTLPQTSFAGGKYCVQGSHFFGLTKFHDFSRFFSKFPGIFFIIFWSMISKWFWI